MTPTIQPVHQQLYNAIFHSPHLNHRKMRVTSEPGKVILEGQVETFFEKQMAQEALRKIDGIGVIQNQLQVSNR
ncbi:MAG: BON domain-containing protein [Planctomycetota bacterium]